MQKQHANNEYAVPVNLCEDTELIHLPDEVAGRVFKLTGLNSALKSLPFNCQLHKAWRCVVTAITVQTPDCLTRDDIKLLSKFNNINKLVFQLPYVSYTSTRHTILAGAVPQRKPVLPIWYVLSAIAHVYQHLTEIRVADGAPGGGPALRVVCTTPCLFSRLERLTIDDKEHVLGADDLWGLANLSALEHLSLSCKAAKGSIGEQPLDIADKLQHLRDLELCTRDGADVPFLQALPGSFTAATDLSLRVDCSSSSSQQQAEQLTAAVSRLTSLHTLGAATSAVIDPASQMKALGQLSQLTLLSLKSRGSSVGNFAVLDALPELQQLYAPDYMLIDPFTHTHLRQVNVRALRASPAWAGKAAASCAISELIISEELDEEGQMPQLQQFHANLRPSEGRYQHLAALLRRQAPTLRSVELQLSQPFMEALPRELPACTELSFTKESISKGSLQLLAMCSLPQLRQLSLGRLAAAAGPPWWWQRTWAGWCSCLSSSPWACTWAMVMMVMMTLCWRSCMSCCLA